MKPVSILVTCGLLITQVVALGWLLCTQMTYLGIIAMVSLNTGSIVLSKCYEQTHLSSCYKPLDIYADRKHSG